MLKDVCLELLRSELPLSRRCWLDGHVWTMMSFGQDGQSEVVACCPGGAIETLNTYGKTPTSDTLTKEVEHPWKKKNCS